MKIVYMDEENLYILWTTWETSMEFSGKTFLMINLKLAKKAGLYLLSIKLCKSHKGVKMIPQTSVLDKFLEKYIYFH